MPYVQPYRSAKHGLWIKTVMTTSGVRYVLLVILTQDPGHVSQYPRLRKVPFILIKLTVDIVS